MSESRTELLAWLNDLLQTNYTKVEQCGTGAAHCQIIDSVFRDVPMSKVKFDAKHQYEYVQNFKVLQSAFTAHKIDKVVPVERLIQCKFQDNLEFLQWIKKYWDTYYQGGAYDAVAHRKSKHSAGPGAAHATTPGAKRAAGSAGSIKKTPSNPSVDRASKGLKSNTSTRVVPTPAGPSTDRAAALGSASNLVEASVVDDLRKQISGLKAALDGMEKERDFYFGKLRDIEILIQQGGENVAETEATTVVKEIQNILYSTEDGFEAPGEPGSEQMQVGYEEETF